MDEDVDGGDAGGEGSAWGEAKGCMSRDVGLRRRSVDRGVAGPRSVDEVE
jgi:hypothetical protein